MDFQKTYTEALENEIGHLVRQRDTLRTRLFSVQRDTRDAEPTMAALKTRLSVAQVDEDLPAQRRTKKKIEALNALVQERERLEIQIDTLNGQIAAATDRTFRRVFSANARLCHSELSKVCDLMDDAFKAAQQASRDYNARFPNVALIDEMRIAASKRYGMEEIRRRLERWL